MKVSPDGTLISIDKSLYLFDRSHATFKLMNHDSSVYLNYIYGSSFSPDSRKLFRIDYYYLGNLTTNPSLAFKFYLYQFDPYSGDKFMSKLFIKELDYHKQLQLGPDNKIYLSAINQNYISNISNPNTKHTTLNPTQFNEVAVELSSHGIGGISQFGLPNFSDALPVTDVAPTINVRPTSCKGLEFYPSECCAASFKWVFGDGDSTTTKYPTHTYTDTGNYTVILRTLGRNITRAIHIGAGSIKAKIFGDTLICDTMISLEYSGTYYDDVTYKWSGTSYKTLVPDEDRVNVKWRTNGSVKFVVTIKTDGCKDSATINITLNPIPQNNSLPDSLFICDSTSSSVITGSTPSNITEIFSYKWYYQLPDSSWRLIDTATRKDFKPAKIPYGTRLIRKINRGGCRNYSNIAVVIILSKTNKIAIGNHPCFKGSSFNVKGNITYGSVSGYINWQYSTNGTDWNYYNTHTQNLDTILNLDNSIFIRRLIDYSGYCEVSSIIVQIRPSVKITSQPQNYYTCKFKHAQFSISVVSRLAYPLQYYVRWYDSATHTWGSFYKSSQIHNIYYIAKYSSTDSIQYAIQTPCGILYSNKVLLKIHSSGPDIDTDPSDQYVNEGSRTNLSGAVFNPYEAGLSYNWQYRKSYNSISNMIWGWAYKAPEWLYVTDSVRNKLAFISGICDDSVEYRMVANNGCYSYSTPARIQITHKSDLWMKDSPSDIGDEPNRFVARWSNPSQRTRDIYKSPDLFNCNNGTPCNSPQNAEFKIFSDNHIRYKIRNKGSITSRPAMLYLYWTMASTGEMWDRSWKSPSDIKWKDPGHSSYTIGYSRFFNQDSGQYFPTGGQINTTGIVIPALTANSVIDTYYPWRPPNPRWYHTTINGQRVTQLKLQICLLARIEYCDVWPHEMAFNEIYRVNPHCG